ncbi:Ferredoxin-thioredoxin reductase catalytic chain [Morus notabilis]|uniref:Ferredoxin-thioredoxin reductase catalytic chain, chloroplastic n=1 Tax=Morus notabilis TaxID=981085 RepID=W9RYK9_9ROSA|nr:Ferredoxin-thioredoxin reductase catalytic chain [Morus notabilis]
MNDKKLLKKDGKKFEKGENEEEGKRKGVPLTIKVAVLLVLAVTVEPLEKSAELMRKFSEQYACRAGTYFCVYKGVTSVVIMTMGHSMTDYGQRVTGHLRPRCRLPETHADGHRRHMQTVTGDTTDNRRPSETPLSPFEDPTRDRC